MASHSTRQGRLISMRKSSKSSCAKRKKWGIKAWQLNPNPKEKR